MRHGRATKTPVYCCALRYKGPGPWAEGGSRASPPAALALAGRLPAAGCRAAASCAIRGAKTRTPRAIGSFKSSQCAPRPVSVSHRRSETFRQDPMATPGNFGGGSTGPDKIFLGIARAPPSAPGRGRAQSPVRRNPNPQTTEHEAATRAARSRGFPFQQSNRSLCQFA
jgi:hypothetical protein